MLLFCHGIAVFFGWIADHATIISAVGSAIATAFIAWFTITLANASTDQGRSTQHSIELARDEFNATHRPKIIVHTVQFRETRTSSESDDSNIGAFVLFFNEGTGEARVIEKYADITPRHDFEALPPLPHIKPVDKPYSLPSGIKDSVTVESGLSLAFEKRIQATDTTRILLCVGMIAYEDKRGHRRETAFCRKFDAETQRWVPSDVAHLEYQY